MKERHEFGLFIIFIFFVSLGYVLWNWPYTPFEVIHDMERLGPIGLGLDLIFAILFFRWLRNKKKED